MKTEIEVEREAGIQQPTTEGRGRPCRYPFKKMSVPTTDAEGRVIYSVFFVPGKEPEDIAGSMAYFKKKHKNRKFTMRKCVKGGRAGVKVYRVA